MQAVILAGGKGRRLEPYTTVLPKPLMPVGDKPILERLIRRLVASGVTEAVIAAGYLSHLIEAYFGDGTGFGLKISYVREERPLGTAGPLGSMFEFLQKDFLVTNGDLLTDLNFTKLFAFHRQVDAAATIAVYPAEQKIDFGVVEFEEDGRLVGYQEKPIYKFPVSMGINVLSRDRIRDLIHPDEYLDIPDLMRSLLSINEDVCCYQEDCQWLDIGRIDDYKLAQDLFADSER